MLKTEDYAKEVSDTLFYFTRHNNHAQAAELLNTWYGLLTSEKPKNNAALSTLAGKWKTLYANNYDSEEVKNIFLMHEEWCKRQPIPHTPLLIYKGRFLPDSLYDMYALTDIIEKDAEQ